MSAQEFKPGDRVRTHNGVGTVRGPNAPATVEYDDGGWDSLSNPRIIASICRLDEPTEPEDKDDLYVEPEPLKEGDWVQVWAKFVREDNLGALVVATPTGAGGEGCRNTYASPDAIVRPDAGQVPPWVKPARCTSLWQAGGRYARCDLNDGHKGDPHGTRAEGWMWTTADEVGRIIEAGVS